MAGGQDSMARARRLLRRAEAIKEEMTDSVEGIWMTFKVWEGREGHLRAYLRAFRGCGEMASG